jgi:hypothetical protein
MHVAVHACGACCCAAQPAAVQDNLLHGRFLAELTKEVFSDLEDTKYQHTEYRISIYGRKTVEWDILAAWVCQNKLYSDKNVWLIQARPAANWAALLPACMPPACCLPPAGLPVCLVRKWCRPPITAESHAGTAAVQRIQGAGFA